MVKEPPVDHLLDLLHNSVMISFYHSCMLGLLRVIECVSHIERKRVLTLLILVLKRTVVDPHFI